MTQGICDDRADPRLGPCPGTTRRRRRGSTIPSGGHTTYEYAVSRLEEVVES